MKAREGYGKSWRYTLLAQLRVQHDVPISPVVPRATYPLPPSVRQGLWSVGALLEYLRRVDISRLSSGDRAFLIDRLSHDC